MTVLRHRQRAVTSVLPHQANRRYAIASRKSGGEGGTGSKLDRVSWTNCEVRTMDATDLAVQITRYQPDVLFLNGDFTYTNQNWANVWGISTVKYVIGRTVDEVYQHYLQMMANPGWAMLMSNPRIRVYGIYDDHEFGGNNFVHTLFSANAIDQNPDGSIGINAVDQADVNDSWNICRIAWERWVERYTDNHLGVYPDFVNNTIPVHASIGNGTPVAGDYPIRYFRVLGTDIEIFAIDCMAYSTPYSDQDGELYPEPSRTMLGAQQKAWLIAGINASTRKFKIIMTSKMVGATGPTDGWPQYVTERDEIIDGYAGVTGVLWTGGDKHWPGVTTNVGGQPVWSGVTGGPATRNYDVRPFDDATGVVLWTDTTFGGTQQPYRHNHATAFLQDGLLHVQVIEAGGIVMWHGSLAPDSNTITEISRET